MRLDSGILLCVGVIFKQLGQGRLRDQKQAEF